MYGCLWVVKWFETTNSWNPILSSKLGVENSFVNYFKKNTEIYKGMKLIDDELGGTTPLDIILTFNQNEKIFSIDENNE